MRREYHDQSGCASWVCVCVCVVERVVEPMHLFPWMDTVCQRWVPVFGVPTSRQPTEYITSTNNHTMQMCSGLQPPNQMDEGLWKKGNTRAASACCKCIRWWLRNRTHRTTTLLPVVTDARSTKGVGGHTPRAGRTSSCCL